MTTTLHRMQSSIWDRVVLFISWAIAGSIFLTLGTLAMAPDDPLGAVSLISKQDLLGMYAQACALAIVVAGMATMVAGRTIADVGTLSAGVGLASVSLTGGTIKALLLERADLGASAQQSLALLMALEAVAWFGVIAAAMLASAFVLYWIYPDRRRPSEDVADLRGLASRASSGFDLSKLSQRSFGVLSQEQTSLGSAVRHLMICAGAMFGTLNLLSLGLWSRDVAHGQVCFVVAAAAFFGAFLANQMAPVRSALWSILAVPVAAIAGYLWAWIRVDTSGSFPPNLPTNSFLRILPIQFIAVGVVAVIISFWYSYDPVERSPHERRTDQP